MKLKVTPILNVGIEMNNGVLGAMPFYNVEVTIGKKTRNHLVNWTHGNQLDGQKLKLESDIGDVKLAILSTCESTEVLVRVIKHGDIVGKIRASLMDCPADTPMLFVWPSSLSDDGELYTALDLMKKDKPIKRNLLPPRHSSEFGYIIKKPFIEVGI